MPEPEPFSEPNAQALTKHTKPHAVKGDHVVDIPTSHDVLGRIGSLEVRLSRNETELRQSQHLRHAVFFEDDQSKKRHTVHSHASVEDIDHDHFDAYCDHLLVIDKEAQPHARFGQIVGSYRLLTSGAAGRAGGFYSDSEFEVSRWIDERSHLNFLEFGRSCVLPQYRNKRTIELLWHGSWAYVLQQKVDVMFGCASFDTLDPYTIAQPLSYLFHHARAQEDWNLAPKKSCAQPMNLLAANKLDTRIALRQMPALIKGYLRLGAKVASSAVVDRQFGTIDVLIIMPVKLLNPRYVSHYGANAERYAV